MLGKQVLTHGRSPLAHKKKTDDEPDFSIRLSRSTYYDNDSVEGILRIQSTKELVLPPVCLALECRLLVQETAACRVSVYTLYKYRKVAGPDHQDYFAVPTGSTEVKFNFNIPENMPATFQDKRIALVWQVRLLQRDHYFETALARATFRKASFYYTIPGHHPMAQAERRNLKVPAPSRPFRVEASVSKDVYSPGEPVKVTVVVDNPTQRPCLYGLQVKLVQTVKATHKGQVLLHSRHVLDSCTHKPKTWPKADLGAMGQGTVQEKTFMLLPRTTKAGRAAHQVADLGGTIQTALGPTINVPATEDGTAVSVQYSVHLKCHVTGVAGYIRLVLPFCRESSRQEIAVVGVSEDDVQDSMIVFPRLDDPPEYDKHRTQSVASYTCLRRGAADSVYGCLSRLGGRGAACFT